MDDFIFRLNSETTNYVAVPQVAHIGSPNIL